MSTSVCRCGSPLNEAGRLGLPVATIDGTRHCSTCRAAQTFPALPYNHNRLAAGFLDVLLRTAKAKEDRRFIRENADVIADLAVRLAADVHYRARLALEYPRREP